jgi:hypothetical protein
LAFALDPALGSNRLIAPKYIPNVLEHIKQHMMLWYTNQMSTYVQGDTNVQFGKYEDSKLVKQIDNAVALASTHLSMDTEEVFKGLLPALEQLGQLMQQFKPPAPPMDGEAQAVLQASMAETQRRAAEDQARLAFDGQKLQADMAQKDKDRQIKIAINSEDNLTTERMKTADLTLDEVKLRQEQEQTAIKLQNVTQRNLGE